MVNLICVGLEQCRNFEEGWKTSHIAITVDQENFTVAIIGVAIATDKSVGIIATK